MNKYLISQTAMGQVEEELEKIRKVNKPQVIEAIATARDHGDLKENAEYHAAKEQQAFLENRLSELELIQKTAEVIDILSINSNRILFGATVELLEETEGKTYTYQILSSFEADVSSGIVGINSPLAKALLGKETKELVEFSTPSKIKQFKVLSIKYI